ncbi:hypothetical protein ES703_119806 [subsurface metagenome]
MAGLTTHIVVGICTGMVYHCIDIVYRLTDLSIFIVIPAMVIASVIPDVLSVVYMQYLVIKSDRNPRRALSIDGNLLLYFVLSFLVLIPYLILLITSYLPPAYFLLINVWIITLWSHYVLDKTIDEKNPFL